MPLRDQVQQRLLRRPPEGLPRRRTLLIEGEGFHWDQKETRLVISNRVRAVIRRNLFSGTNALPPPPPK